MLDIKINNENELGRPSIFQRTNNFIFFFLKNTLKRFLDKTNVCPGNLFY